MKGHWIKTLPTQVGDYHIADRGGYLAGIRSVIMLGDGTLSDVHMHLPWSGWWWSEPIQMPPATPDWEA